MIRNLSRSFLVLILGLTLLPSGALAQGSNTSSSSTSTSQQQQQQQQPAAAGGPQGDTGPVALPKKKPEEEKPQTEKPEKVKNPAGLEDFSLRVNVPLVNVDVSVITKDGQFIPGLKKENFKVSEDGVAQNITNLTQTEAPITAVMLVEFAQPNLRVNQQTYQSLNDMLNASYIFVQSLKKEDYVALISYDMKPQLQVDFTQDKQEIFQALNHMRIPGFSETNVFDALYDTIDRLEGIEGRKYIVYIGGGLDTFSKLTLDKFLAKLKTTRDITIYCVSTGGAFRAIYGDNMGAVSSLNFLQADNQLNTFARMTGGRAYFPRFVGEMPDIFRDIAQTIRNQYLISYHPSNTKQDGSYRKIKVELVGANGGPLKIENEKGKAMKYQVIAREGYRAKQIVE